MTGRCSTAELGAVERPLASGNGMSEGVEYTAMVKNDPAWVLEAS